VTAVARLRPAEPKDCRSYWEMANDPLVRAMALRTEPIPWETHVAWFSERLNSPSSHLFLLTSVSASEPIAQIRFDEVSKDVFEIDLSVARMHRGCGYGGRLLELGIHALETRVSWRVLRAVVKAENSASLALFLRSGFNPLDEDPKRQEGLEVLVRTS